jgi:DNA-binding HxlR family transcriptional regulator
MTRHYSQNCPIALGLDVLGERWTLLIVRELLGGPRRYGDLRAELPGIATNLLAERLRELEQADLIEPTELPPPVARTVYSLSEAGWRKVLPVIQAIATFGLDMVEPNESALTPLNGIAPTPAERKAARKQITFHGEKPDINAMRAAFQLT